MKLYDAGIIAICLGLFWIAKDLFVQKPDCQLLITRDNGTVVSKAGYGDECRVDEITVEKLEYGQLNSNQ